MPPDDVQPSGSKLDVYTLGRFGVNRVSSPVQVKDGELLVAQNATVKTFQQQQGLSKRDGMSRLNVTTASGAILNIHSLSFTDPGGYPVEPDVWGVGGSLGSVGFSFSGDWTSGPGPAELSLAAGQSGTITCNFGVPPFQLLLNGVATLVSALPPGFTILTLDQPVSPFLFVISQTGSPDFTILIEIAGSPDISAVPHTFGAPPDPEEVAAMFVTLTATCGGGEALTISNTVFVDQSPGRGYITGTYTT